MVWTDDIADAKEYLRLAVEASGYDGIEEGRALIISFLDRAKREIDNARGELLYTEDE